MKYSREDEINVGGRDLYVIDVLIHNGDEYIYAQEVVDGEVEGGYCVYNVSKDMKPVDDANELQELIPLFIENIQKDL